MNTLELILIIGSLLSATAGFVFVGLRLGGGSKKPDWGAAAEHDVEHIFNNEFREELRNRGRLQFEKIIGENAMFLQQDLRLTTSQLNEFLKAEVTKQLETEFAGYEQSITDAKNLAVESIAKTQEAIEEQRQAMTEQLAAEVQAEKQRVVKRFEQHMAEIVNHYVLSAIGDQIDLNDQLQYIIAEMERNKKDIMQDIANV